MVFQFEHVSLDPGPGGKWDIRPLRPARPEGQPRPLAGRAGRDRLEQPVLEQPRPAPRGVPVRRRRRVPGSSRPRCSATVLHLHRGTPYVYQGEELGMTNVAVRRDRRLPGHRVAEPLSRRRSRSGRGPGGRCWPRCARVSRDNARTPMQWDASPQAGFTTGTPWMAVNPNYPEINAAAAVDDPDSVFHHYRAADRAAAHRAGGGPRRLHHAAAATTSGVYAFTRRLGDAELLVLGNFSGGTVRPRSTAPGKMPDRCSATTRPSPALGCVPGQ